MRLTDLDAELVALVPPHGWRVVDTVAEASGISFLCPGCYEKNGGVIGTHTILAWFRDRHVPDHIEPGPGRWYAAGTSIDTLTLTPSVMVGCWHGWIRNGEAVKA